MQEHQGAARAAPVPVVEVQTVDGYPFVLGVLGQGCSSRITLRIFSDGLWKVALARANCV